MKKIIIFIALFNLINISNIFATEYFSGLPVCLYTNPTIPGSVVVAVEVKHTGQIRWLRLIAEAGDFGNPNGNWDFSMIHLGEKIGTQTYDGRETCAVWDGWILKWYGFE